MGNLECRAVLDPGSQVNLITKKLVRKLGVTTNLGKLSIQSIGNRKQPTQSWTKVRLESRITEFSQPFEAYVLQQMVPPQPAETFDIRKWLISKNISLVEPGFNI